MRKFLQVGLYQKERRWQVKGEGRGGEREVLGWEEREGEKQLGGFGAAPEGREGLGNTFR